MDSIVIRKVLCIPHDIVRDLSVYSNFLVTLEEITDLDDHIKVYLPPHLEDYIEVARQIIAYVHSDMIEYPNMIIPLTLREFQTMWGIWHQVAEFLGFDCLEFPYKTGDINLIRSLKKSEPEFAKEVAADMRLRVLYANNNPLDAYHGMMELTPDNLAKHKLQQVTSSESTVITLDHNNLKTIDASNHSQKSLATVSFDTLNQCITWLRNVFGIDHWYNTKYEQKKGKIDGIVIAGGFMASCAMGCVKFDPTAVLKEMPLKSDIDVFICINKYDYEKDERDQKIRTRATEIVQACLTSLQSIPIPKEHLIICGMSESSKVINVLIKMHPDNPFIKIQFILRVFDTPAHVIHGFDIQPCKVVYDGKCVMATPGAIRSFATRTMILDPTKWSTSTAHRYIKYAERMKMAIKVPGVAKYLIDLLIHAGDQHVQNMSTTNAIADIVFKFKSTHSFNSICTRFAAPSFTVTDYDDLLKNGIEEGFIVSQQISFDRIKRNIIVILEQKDNVFTGAYNPVNINMFSGFEQLW